MLEARSCFVSQALRAIFVVSVLLSNALADTSYSDFKRISINSPDSAVKITEESLNKFMADFRKTFLTTNDGVTVPTVMSRTYCSCRSNLVANALYGMPGVELVGHYQVYLGGVEGSSWSYHVAPIIRINGENYMVDTLYGYYGVEEWIRLISAGTPLPEIPVRYLRPDANASFGGAHVANYKQTGDTAERLARNTETPSVHELSLYFDAVNNAADILYAREQVRLGKPFPLTKDSYTILHSRDEIKAYVNDNFGDELRFLQSYGVMCRGLFPTY